MSVPTENLRIKNFIQERVVTEWCDDTGTGAVSTLGSCLRMNQQRPEFFMRVGYDADGHIHIHFSLTATVKAAGKRHAREMLLILPTNVLCKDIDFKNASKPLKTSDLTSLDAATLHEAGISKSETIIRVQFDLMATGFVVTKRTTSKMIKPTTNTSSDLILGLESLSRVLHFRVYMRPGYASKGLKELHNCLMADRTGLHRTNMVDMYVRQGAMVLDWDKIEHKTGLDLQPPPYVEESLKPAVEVPRTPPFAIRKEAAEVETARIPTMILIRDAISPSPTSEIHGIFSDMDDSMSIEADIQNIESLKNTEGDFWNNMDSDEERHAFLNARELSQELNQPISAPSVSKALLSEFQEWIEGAMTINRFVHTQQRLGAKLLALSRHACAPDIMAFNACKVQCSAILFYDPEDSDSTSELWNEANQGFISDLEEDIRWANGFHRSVEMCSPAIRREFVELGTAARAAALQPKHKKKYERQRAACITRIFAKFGGTNASIRNLDRERLDPKSWRCLSNEHHVSKRLKT